MSAISSYQNKNTPALQANELNTDDDDDDDDDNNNVFIWLPTVLSTGVATLGHCKDTV